MIIIIIKIILICQNNININQNNINLNNVNNNNNNYSETTEIREKWLKNLTNVQIPQDVIDVLSLGENFNFNANLKKSDFFEIFKFIQHSIYNNNYDENNVKKIRRKVIGIVNQHLHNKKHINFFDKQFEVKKVWLLYTS